MLSLAIRAEGISKEYRIGTRPGYRTLRDAIASAFRWERAAAGETASVWALRDVSFEVSPGEIVGIIGRNGSGKSTLLKVLSAITEPTFGKAEIRGRVASMLEIGTGFHPDLTGRENMLLNGIILGMSRREVREKYDAILAFAEVERFIDTPVKHYSSGMYMRLAFAVAAHLEPDILIVDEVLAVGDADFQKKCLGKMEEVGGQGRTVLFVSHNVPTILRLCTRVLLLESGRLIADGAPHEVAAKYLHEDVGRRAERFWSAADAPGDAVARLRAVRVLHDFGSTADTVDITEPITVEIQYSHLDPDVRATVSMYLINEDGITVFCSNDYNNREWWAAKRRKGLVAARCRIPANFLAEGRFYVLAALYSYNPDRVHAIERDAVAFQVLDRTTGEGVRGVSGRDWPGVVRPMLQWDVTVLEEDEEDSLGG